MQLLPQDYEEDIIYKLKKISEENKGSLAVVKVCYKHPRKDQKSCMQ